MQLSRVAAAVLDPGIDGDREGVQRRRGSPTRVPVGAAVQVQVATDGVHRQADLVGDPLHGQALAAQITHSAVTLGPLRAAAPAGHGSRCVRGRSPLLHGDAPGRTGMSTRRRRRGSRRIDRRGGRVAQRLTNRRTQAAQQTLHRLTQVL